MARADGIELGNGTRIPILYEDRSVLAIDKPPGWMLVPVSWQNTEWNLQAALLSSIARGAFWARSRGLRFLRYVHRLDAETTGVLLLGKSPGAVNALGRLFESRRLHKAYLAVVAGKPAESAWECRLPLGPDPRHIGRIRVDRHGGKPAETAFEVLEARWDARGQPLTLIEARPRTGRTHQIRVHLCAAGCPVVGDPLYGPGQGVDLARGAPYSMGLRAVRLEYSDPFTRRPVHILADAGPFRRCFGFTVK